MNMYLWIFNLVCSAVYGISRISGPNLKAVNFAKELEGQKLKGSLIKEIEVYSESSCRFECVNEERCQSYNFGTLEGDSGKFKCQLSDSDRFVGFANFTEDEHFIYRGIKSTCEEDDPCKENETCVVDYKSNTHFCKCIRDCPKNCLDYDQNGSKTDGVYWVYPDEEEPFQVLCDMTSDGGGWTIFQRRMDGSVDFYVDWESYKRGFGNLEGEFWLGNDYLHRLTASASMVFRIDMEDYEGDRRFAEYTTFAVAHESDDYRVTIDGYRGTAGNALVPSVGNAIRNMSFTTRDRDNDVVQDGNCAVAFRGGWWYSACHSANPNGLYQGGSLAQGITWAPFRGQDYSLRHIEIKLRPV